MAPPAAQGGQLHWRRGVRQSEHHSKSLSNRPLGLWCYLDSAKESLKTHAEGREKHSLFQELWIAATEAGSALTETVVLLRRYKKDLNPCLT